MTKAPSYDYIIVGSGAAGAIIASRLAQRSTATILLLERGPPARSLLLQMPAGMTTILSTGRFTRALACEPNLALGGRSIPLFEGAVLGGGTSVNGMAYARGHPRDYDQWASEGCEGWSYAEVLDYFRRSERNGQRRDQYHGQDGPIGVCTSERPNVLARAFLQAGTQAGHGQTTDINGVQPEGFGPSDRMVDNGRRASTATAYLKPARHLRNLTVLTNTDVLNVLIEGDRAVGVTVRRDGQVYSIKATCEIILSAGGISSPHLLMLSGIGASAHLAKFDIRVTADSPAVGANLQNHVDVAVQARNLRPTTSLLPFMKGPRRYLAAAEWLMFGTGPISTNHLDATALIRSDSQQSRPDLKLTLANIAIRPGSLQPYPFHAFRVQIKLMLPKSRGTVRLATADPMRAPSIAFNYLQEPADLAALRHGVRRVRDLVRQEALRAYSGEELSPGADVTDDTSLDQWIRGHVRPLSHQSGTCRMGRVSDPRSVVDPSLRVIGIRGLRVADASIMPSLIAGYTAAPTMMIGEKAADMILSDSR
jgi:choline dehydrogenase